MLLSNFVIATGVGQTEQSVYSRKQVGGSNQITTVFLLFSFALAWIPEISTYIFIIAIEMNIYHNRLYRHFYHYIGAS